jgi:hypothetical protein
LQDQVYRTLGLGALAALALGLAGLAALVPVEAAVWDAILTARGCGTDGLVAAAGTATAVALALLLAAAAGLRLRRDGAAAVWPALATLALGALAHPVLTRLLLRPGPSDFPAAVAARGFPDGRAMYAGLAALALVVLAAGLPGRRLWRTAALLAAAAAVAASLLAGDRWLADVAAGLLTAAAVVALGVPAVRRRPAAAPLAAAAGLAAALAAGTLLDAAWRLPSPLSRVGPETLDLDAGNPAVSGMLFGNWAGLGREDPVGPVLWLNGAGGLSVLDVPSPGDLGPDAPARYAGPQSLAFAGRPGDSEDGCLLVRVAVNGTIVAGFVPYPGWREYRVPLPAGTLRPGTNEIQLSARAPDGRPRRFALAYLRLKRGEPAGAAQ